MIIYNDDFSAADENYISELKEEYSENTDTPIEEVTDSDVYDYFIDDLQYLGEDFTSDLTAVDSEISGTIIAIASLGLWNGRNLGYKEIYRLQDITSCFEDYNTVEIDRYNNLTLTAVHHDGTNYVIFRELKPELSDTQVENFENKLYNGTATKKDISRYTNSIGKYLKSYYTA